jgi:hypothetical protein
VLCLHFAPFCLSIWCPVRNFLTSNYLLFSPKNPLFTAILPFLAMFLMALEGFIYTVAADIYA